MKHITIHTNRYKTELADFAKNIEIHNLCTIVKEYPLRLAWENSVTNEFTRELLLLLHRIATYENPVYRYSTKLQDLALGLKDTALFFDDVKRLKSFLQANKELHIDGYIAFRIDEYCEKLDTILYTIVKKINFGK